MMLSFFMVKRFKGKTHYDLKIENIKQDLARAKAKNPLIIYSFRVKNT